MFKVRNLATLLALSSVAVLPACSWFGGDHASRSSSNYPSQSYAASTNSASQTATAPELTPDMVRSVQQTLQQENIYHGRVDGVWGPATQASVRTYQQQHNMNVTGQLDQPTLAAMNLGTGPNNAAQQPPDSQRYGSNYNPPPNNTDNPQPANNNQPNSSNTH